MAILTDFAGDILAHRHLNRPLAKNLCQSLATCLRPHCPPVPLDGISEKKITGDGSGPPLCVICDTYCSLDHSDFMLFCDAIASACLAGGRRANDRRTKAAKTRDIRLWKVLVQFGCHQVFLSDGDNTQVDDQYCIEGPSFSSNSSPVQSFSPVSDALDGTYFKSSNDTT